MADDQGHPAPVGARPWSRATSFWSDGPGAHGPAAHFRTSAHVGDVLAEALLHVLRDVDERLDRPPVLDLVDVGAGQGELLTALVRLAGADLGPRLRPLGVDLLPRPEGLDERVRWVQGHAPDAVPDVHGLVVAHEWLDECPVDVVEVDGRGRRRLVLVEDDGTEHLGPSLDDDDACTEVGVDAARARSWLATWWPVAAPGDRAEVGIARDDAWAGLVQRLAAGTAVAVDYGHVRPDRAGGRFAAGTLAAYSEGHQVRPRPDGSVNLTAHVATDALVARTGGTVVRQREALLDLGVDPSLPSTSLVTSDPAAYADALVAASDLAELLDPAGLGAFHWVRLDR